MTADELDARWCAEVGHANKWCARARDLETRLARYEAPGPALLIVEHAADCGVPLPVGARTCGAERAALACRGQHALDVAVVEPVRQQYERVLELRRQFSPTREHRQKVDNATGHLVTLVGEMLAALKDGAK